MSGTVLAFTVGFESTQLQLYPGQVHETNFNLQNYGTDAVEVEVQATIKEGQEYITFPQGTTFTIPAQNNINVPVSITIPEDARVGDTYPVSVLFEALSGEGSTGEAEGEQTIGFVINRERNIDLNIVEKPGAPEAEVSAMWWILAVVVLIIVVVVIWFVVKSKKETAVKNPVK